MPTIEECKEYLGIDFEDDVVESNLKRYIAVADSWLRGAIGMDYPRNDERAKQLALFLIEDLYDRSSYSVKENATITKLKNDFILQLQMEGMSKDDL